MDTRAGNTQDNASGHTEGGHWLTYDQLAEVRGIDRLSAAKLALRHGWPKERDKHRIARVLVPPEWLLSRPTGGVFGTAEGTDRTPGARPDRYGQARAVERSMWREQLSRERDRADKAERETARLMNVIDDLESRIADYEARAELAEQALAAESARADKLAERQTAISRLLASSPAARGLDRGDRS
jgi:hypothetical protein